MPSATAKEEKGTDAEQRTRDLRLIDNCRRRSQRARQTRTNKNKENWDLYHGRQDWSHKQDFQSQEFLPDLPIAVEQVTGLLERGLTDYTDWFDLSAVGYGYPLIDPPTMKKLLQFCLDRLYKPGHDEETTVSFPRVLGNAIKVALMEAEIVLKIYPKTSKRVVFGLERGIETVDAENPYGSGMIQQRRPTQKVTRKDKEIFRLAIDVITWEDFYPDPSGRNQWCIHEVTRTVHELLENEDYDPDEIERLIAQMRMKADTQREKNRRTDQDQIEDEETVRVREFWGNLIDPKTGEMLYENVLITTAGNTAMLRKPQENPFWHGHTPFIRAPLIEVPNSEVHKALLDYAGPMAKLMNELMNLMIDEGFSNAWSVRQARPDLLENADDITNGIPPGFTGILKPGVAAGTKWLEEITTGQVPIFAEQLLQRVQQSFQVGIATPSLKMGQLPPRQVKATEVVTANASSESLFDSIAARTDEDVIEPALSLGWQVIWQFLDDFTDSELVEILGVRRAIGLQGMSPEERFVLLAKSAKFKASGLRALMGRVKEFQKLVTLLQMLGTNPALAMAFDQKYSIVKALGQAIRTLGLDPILLEKEAGAGPEFNPQALGVGGKGGAPPGTGLGGSEMEKAFAEANPTGWQGVNQGGSPT